MHYKKINNFVNLFFAGGSFLFLIIGITFVPFGLWIMVSSFVLSFILFSVFIFSELLNFAKAFAISKFGSREDNDLLSHFSDLFFAMTFAGRISTQVDITNEEQMTVFADGLINMYGSEVMAEARKFYPELSEQYWISNFSTLAAVEKSVMLHVFFSDTYGGLDPIKPEKKLIEKFPFMSQNTLKEIIIWWKRFKLKMEWQDRVDGIQR